MTILVKGMEMPTWCNDCPFNDKEYDVCVATTDRRSIRIPVWERMRLFHREKWCPLVEVPTPHGRLGDLDRLYKHIKVECNIYGKPTIGFEDGNKVLKIIADTRTVIEAEGEE